LAWFIGLDEGKNVDVTGMVKNTFKWCQLVWLAAEAAITEKMPGRFTKSKPHHSPEQDAGRSMVQP
jgi:hypothetical protein